MFIVLTNFDFEEVKSGRRHVSERRDVQTGVQFILVGHVGPTEQPWKRGRGIVFIGITQFCGCNAVWKSPSNDYDNILDKTVYVKKFWRIFI